MPRLSIRYAVAAACLMSPMHAHADGKLNIEPSIRTTVSHDDNIFRFSSDEQAEASSLSKSDTIKTLAVGLAAQLSLSRQMFSASASVSENRYSNNEVLDNQGKSLNLRWNWRLGEHVYGELSTSSDKALTGFDNNNVRIKNIRESDTHFASLNWLIKPRLIAYGSMRQGQQENDTTANAIFDRDDDSYEVGLRYATRLGNQLSLFYRHTDTEYPNRTSILSAFFGEASVAKEYGVTMQWLPTAKLRLSGRLSNYKFIRESALQEDFSNINYRINLTYLMTDKMDFLLSTYNEAVQVDSNVASNVEFSGVDLDGTYRLTDKLSLVGGLQYQKREFQGDRLFNLIPSSFEQTIDKRWTALIGLSYKPIENAFLQVRYRADDRSANVASNEFESNFFEFTGKYTF